MIAISIDVTKITKDRLHVGKKGKYLDCVLIENKGGRDQYDNDGFVAESVSKEEREAGTKGVIIGNWKHLGQPAAPKLAAASGWNVPPTPAATSPTDDDVLF